MEPKVKGGTFGREKKGTSPSNPLTRKPSTSSSSPSSSSPSSPTTGKPVPNYLKPTISSSLDFSRLPKKSILDPSAQKPVLNRRKSFDRPPPASQGVRNVPGHLRSSAVSQKASTSSVSSVRPAAERGYARSSTTLKDSRVEQTLSKSRTLKKSSLSSGGIKKGTNVPKIVAFESSIDDDHCSSDQLIVEDDFVGVVSEVMSLPEISEMPDSNQELGDPITTNIEEKLAENPRENDIAGESVVLNQVAEQGLSLTGATLDRKLCHKYEKIVEPSTIKETGADLAKVNQTVDFAGETNEVKNVASNVEKNEKIEIEKKEDLVLEQEARKGKEENSRFSSLPADEVAPVKAQTAKDENSVISSPPAMAAGDAETVKAHTAEDDYPSASSLPAGDVAPVEEKASKDEKPNVSSPPAGGAAPVKAHIAVDETPSASSTPAGDAAPVKVQIPKDEKASAATPQATVKAHIARGKKEKQENNDVIEQTATKLMGGSQKNKVLALAGAFQTVISMQDTNKKR